MNPSPQKVTELLRDWRNGDASALDKLMPLVYDELRRAARSAMARQPPFDVLRNDPHWTSKLYEMQRAGVKVRPKDRHPDLPDAADATILRALSFDPGDRHLKSSGVRCWMADHSREAVLNDRSETSKEQVEYWLEGKQRIEAMNSPSDQWLPLVLRALANVGVRCPGVKPSALENVPITQPTRLDQSLKSLRLVAGFTNQIWPLSAERRPHVAARSAIRGLGAPQDGVQHGHRLGSRVCLAIESDRAGHLLLLD